MGQQYLLTGGNENQLLPALRRALTYANEIEIAVSFIRSTGLDLIFSDLEAALLSDIRNVKLSLLTSDYMSITDPKALKRLLLLTERGANVSVFQTGSGESFHLKAYIFVRCDNGEVNRADAFVGSSNISSKALTDGLEWNYHIDFPNNNDTLSEKRINEIRLQFQKLWEKPQVRRLSYEWIESYESRYRQARTVSPTHTARIDVQEPQPAIPTPYSHQLEALQALTKTRAHNFNKGLVVLATGLGKTYLSAFDASQMNAEKVLFVAHREEILLQAEQAFLSVFPLRRIGRYNGTQKDKLVDMLFASVQTIGQKNHLEKFDNDYFDYIVVDEFHHAAAISYQRLLNYFKPKFLLGLTATPDRTDGSDILKLCGQNLVYRKDLFDGINDQHLCAFHYFGIYDREVNYEHIPWRSGKFDPLQLSTKLATASRAQHVLREWRQRRQQRTLAFCASQKHADYMAEEFRQAGFKSESIHSDSRFTRSEALELLGNGDIEVLFSVDLFNEGVDLPQIDTVMMLRPTESKILFLQQLGRGLRLSANKSHLVVLDFVGNHHSFLNRPDILFGHLFKSKPTRNQLIDAVRNPKNLLPDGCYVNYDLEFIEFLDSLAGDALDEKYKSLKVSLGRRPTLIEFWRSGANLSKLRLNYGSWWEFIDEQGDASPDELQVIESHVQWFRDLTKTNLTKSYKLILLKTLLNRRVLHVSVTLQNLARWGKEWYLSHPDWISDLPDSILPLSNLSDRKWLDHWKKNPIAAWCREEQWSNISWFQQSGMMFTFQQRIDFDEVETFASMTEELLDWRIEQYKRDHLPSSKPIPIDDNTNTSLMEEHLRFFPNIKIACGHFKSGHADIEERVLLPCGFGRLSPERHFIARASGNSMNGGKTPIFDGDYLLFEQITSESAGSISNTTVAIERQDQSGDNQYLLRKILKDKNGGYILRAYNESFEDLVATDEMTTFARLVGKVDPLEIFRGYEFMREEIPALFGAEYNAGSWLQGHIILKDEDIQVLLVTLNKQGKAAEHQYHDYFIDRHHFHWQSQNSTSPKSSRGKAIINHQKSGGRVYLFVRENKLRNGKAAPFKNYGEVTYEKHQGAEPMSVMWKLCHPISESLIKT
jgi:superfamily II DNA or RNA helicase/HKD family nuclease